MSEPRSPKHKICILTSAHISYNPRVVKEADALAANGFDVRVVSLSREPEKSRLDDELMQSRTWRLERVNAQSGMTPRFAAVRQKLLTVAWRSSLPVRADVVHSRFVNRLAAVAGRDRADLFIAHTLQALPAAAWCARRFRTKLGFDAEDFHSGETAEGTVEGRLARVIEETYLPICDYVTAASDGIGDRYSRLPGVVKPVTILNASRLADRFASTSAEPLESDRRGTALSLYWYSQVIGEDRGLEDAIDAVARLRDAVHLHIRGKIDPVVRARLARRCGQLAIVRNVHFRNAVRPTELVSRAAQHDIGLASEVGHTENRKIAVTNKILTYFVAGIAIAATNVPGQKRIMDNAPEAGFLYPPGDIDVLTSALRKYALDSDALQSAKRASLRAAQTLYCWEHEEPKLLAVVSSILDSVVLTIQPDLRVLHDQ